MYIVSIAGREGFLRTFTSFGSMLWWMQDFVENYSTEPTNFLVEEGPKQEMPIACDSVVVFRSKEDIDKDLTTLGPQLEVVGSRITEDGYELILEGPKDQLEDILFFWSER